MRSMQALIVVDRVKSGWAGFLKSLFPTFPAVQALRAETADLRDRLVTLERIHRDVNLYYMQTIGAALNDRIDIASAGMRERHEIFTDVFAKRIDHIASEMKIINDANVLVRNKLDTIRAKLRGLSED